MKKLLPYFLAAASGLIYALPFISPMPGLVMLIAFIPLLYAEQRLTESAVKQSKLKVFLAAFVCFFVANILLLWWIEKLLSYWSVFFFLYNATLSALVFLAFSATKKTLGKAWGYLSFIVYALAFDFIYLNISFSFPAIQPGILLGGLGSTAFVQWYEYTGVLGGSLWVLLSNVLIFLLCQQYQNKKKPSTKLWTATLAVVLVPIFISLYIFGNYKETDKPMEVVVVQPNIDPYSEKFSISWDSQLDKMIDLSKDKITPNTEYILFPETAIDSNLWLNNITENYMVHKIKDSLLHNYPQAKVISGINMMEYYVVQDDTPPTPSAKKVSDRIYYDFYNAAIQIDSQGDVEAYKKSKLVLGTEYVPLSNKFAAMENLSMQLGGSAQSRGIQPYPSLLSSHETEVATIICYESLFGEYVSEFAKLGGEAIFVLTNDGWWDNTPGPRMHFRFSQLRAIENRRAVVRCANTGISGYIDQKGDIIQQSEWWTATAMKNNINKNTQLTFYSRHGDYIGKIAALVSIVIILSSLFSIFRKNKKGKKRKRSKK